MHVTGSKLFVRIPRHYLRNLTKIYVWLSGRRGYTLPSLIPLTVATADYQEMVKFGKLSNSEARHRALDLITTRAVYCIAYPTAKFIILPQFRDSKLAISDACFPLTEQLLLSLKYNSKKAVQKKMVGTL